MFILDEIFVQQYERAFPVSVPCRKWGGGDAHECAVCGESAGALMPCAADSDDAKDHSKPPTAPVRVAPACGARAHVKCAHRGDNAWKIGAVTVLVRAL